MKGKETVAKAGGIGDNAVKAATGKSWTQWLSVLDKSGCKAMTHKQIVAVVSGKHGIGPWWQQMVTVGYEQARGLRQKHEKPEGFQISRSKTIAAPVGEAFHAWKDQKARKRWLADDLVTIRKATANKSVRAGWDGGATLLEVNFYSKGSDKTQVTVQHSKLRSAAQAAKMKTLWGKNLDCFKELLEA